MRTNLFLSTLFAVSLVGSVAMAERPARERPAREPRAIQQLRIHGDTVDKSESRGARAARASNPASTVRDVKNPLRDAAASRVNCSDTGADCSKASRPAQASHASGPGASRPGEQRGSAKSPLHQRADARVNCNEADECSSSSKASQPRWAGSGRTTKQSNDAISLAVREEQKRMGAAGSDRMVCNEADECMMSSKAAKKLWALESIKAGTFRGAAATTKDAPAEKGLKASERAARDAAKR